MERAIFHAHSGLRYLIFLMLIIVLVKAIINALSGRRWGRNDIKLTTFLLSITHLQVLLGLFMYFFIFHYYNLFSEMSDPVARWKAVEHMATMLIFAALVTVLHTGNKKLEKPNRNRRAIIFIIIATAVAFSGIPLDRWF
ncbi:hypothetical protein GC194_10245 [bacterium]|nr:hypothetical protein [bacterium]